MTFYGFDLKCLFLIIQCVNAIFLRVQLIINLYFYAVLMESWSLNQQIHITAFSYIVLLIFLGNCTQDVDFFIS